MRVNNYLSLTEDEETIIRGGEGLILRKPDAPYLLGRSEFSLKVKVTEKQFRVDCKPTYVEKAFVTQMERIERTGEGFYKYCHIEVTK